MAQWREGSEKVVNSAIDSIRSMINRDACIQCSLCGRRRPFSKHEIDEELDTFHPHGSIRCDICRRYKRMRGHYPIRPIGR